MEPRQKYHNTIVLRRLLSGEKLTAVQADAQPESTSTSVGKLQQDYNELLAKLKASGLMKTT